MCLMKYLRWTEAAIFWDKSMEKKKKKRIIYNKSSEAEPCMVKMKPSG